MRPLIWLTFLLAALYGGYWFVGSRAVLSATEAALAQMKADGTADYSGVSLVGFPSRFDLTIGDPRLIGRDGFAEWSAPFLQLFALSYRPNRLIAVWPHDQRLRLGRQDLSITSTDLRASVALGASTGLPLDHAELAGDDLAVTGSPGWSAAAKRAILASRQSGGPQNHEVALVLTDLTLGEALRGALDPARRRPPALPEVRAGAIFDLDRPLDRTATATAPRVTALRAIDISAVWGAMQVKAAGELSIGADGNAVGRIDVEARNWRDLLALLRDAGVFTPAFAAQIENGLAAVATASGDGSVLKLPLIFKQGESYLGPFVLGPAPRL